MMKVSYRKKIPIHHSRRLRIFKPALRTKDVGIRTKHFSIAIGDPRVYADDSTCRETAARDCRAFLGDYTCQRQSGYGMDA
jgi:hypothetical protein